MLGNERANLSDRAGTQRGWSVATRLMSTIDRGFDLRAHQRVKAEIGKRLVVAEASGFTRRAPPMMVRMAWPMISSRLPPLRQQRCVPSNLLRLRPSPGRPGWRQRSARGEDFPEVRGTIGAT